MFLHRPVHARSMILAANLAMTVVGCTPGQIPCRDWLMQCADRDGNVVVLEISSEELFGGKTELMTQTVIDLDSELHDARVDFKSGRIATAESRDTGDVIRVYEADQTLLFEHRCESKRMWDGSSKFCLSKGGRRLIFALDDGRVAIADLKHGNTKSAFRLTHIPNDDNTARNLSRFVCFPNDSGGFYVQVDARFYRVDQYAVGTSIPPDGEQPSVLCGVIGNVAVFTNSLWGAWTIRKGLAGDVVGTARSGHSYSRLLGVSPCGEFIAYDVPGAFWTQRKIYIHHLKTGRRARLRISPKGRPGTWVEKRDDIYDHK